MRWAPSILLDVGSWAVGRRHAGEKRRASQGEVWGVFAHLLGDLTVAQQGSGEEGSGRAPMLWGWGGAEGRGPWTGAWARASLIPSRESARYQRLPASLEHPAVLGGLGERRKRSVTLWPEVFSQQAFGPCLGPGARGGSFSLRLCVSSSHAHTEAHVHACVGTCACLCGHVVCRRLLRFLTAPQFLPLFAHPPP